MATERGSAVKLVAYEESTYAVAPTSPNGLQITTTSVGLKMKRGMNNNDDVLRNDRNPSQGTLGRKDVLGPVVTKPGSREAAFLMKHMLGSYSTSSQVASVTVSAGGTGYTDGATATFSAPPAGGVTALGTITVVGGAITAVVISNPGSGYTSAPTVTAPTGTGATLVAVLGGLSTSIIKVGALPPGLTFDKYFGTLGAVERYLGGRLNQMSGTVTDDGVWTPSFDIIGSDEVDDTALLDVTPHAYAISPFAIPKVTVTEGGSPMKIAKDIKLTLMNNLDGNIGRVVGNTGAIADCPEGIFKVDLTMTVLFQSLALLNKAKNETKSSFSLLFTQGTHSWTLAFNEIRYDVEEPEVTSPNGIPVPMHAYAFYESDAAASCVVSTHVNDVTSLATFPA